jgi:branched-chain amino acid transport system ATP-binding protein
MRFVTLGKIELLRPRGDTCVTQGPLLSVRDVTVRFGGIVALNAVTFDVPKGGISGLIGPNGAGKTTLFNCLSRLYRYEQGDVLFEGTSITSLPVHAIAELGIGRTFQNLAMFKSLSVRHNIMIGAHAAQRWLLASALSLPRVAREEAKLASRANELLVADATRRCRPTRGRTSFGIQKR